jgi:precorrin-3B synthase
VVGGRLAGAGDVADLLAACRAFLAVRTTEWRLAEVPDGAARVASLLGRQLAGAAPVGARVPVGRHSSLVVAHVPFGRLTQAHLRVLAAAAEVVLTPWHSVVVDAGTDLSAFVTDPSSPWTGLTACVGTQCSRALADVRADAVPGDVPTHWSGCARRCGKPAGSRDVVATEKGYEVLS